MYVWNKYYRYDAVHTFSLLKFEFLNIAINYISPQRSCEHQDWASECVGERERWKSRQHTQPKYSPRLSKLSNFKWIGIWMSLFFKIIVIIITKKKPWQKKKPRKKKKIKQKPINNSINRRIHSKAKRRRFVWMSEKSLKSSNHFTWNWLIPLNVAIISMKEDRLHIK